MSIFSQRSRNTGDAKAANYVTGDYSCNLIATELILPARLDTMYLLAISVIIESKRVKFGQHFFPNIIFIFSMLSD